MCRELVLRQTLHKLMPHKCTFLLPECGDDPPPSLASPLPVQIMRYRRCQSYHKCGRDLLLCDHSLVKLIANCWSTKKTQKHFCHLLLSSTFSDFPFFWVDWRKTTVLTLFLKADKIALASFKKKRGGRERKSSLWNKWYTPKYLFAASQLSMPTTHLSACNLFLAGMTIQ